MAARISDLAGVLDPDAMPSWLAKLFPCAQASTRIVAGVNDDDCAVVRLGDKLLVITTDYLNANPIALELGVGNLSTLGRLTVAASLADLCGSGATPRALLLAITLPHGTRRREFELIIRGMRNEARRWDVPVVGGDSKLGHGRALLAVAVGSARSKRNLFLRNKARIGDIVWASDTLGSCAAAVLALAGRPSRSKPPPWAVRALTVPNLPLGKSMRLSEARLGRGGADVSDGLGSDLQRICRASDVDVVVDASSIPIASVARATANKHGYPAWALPFSIGGDFQFIVTTSPRASKQLEALGFYPIGKVVAKGQSSLRLPDDSVRPLPVAGHRDARGLRFAEEVHHLLGEATRGS